MSTTFTQLAAPPRPAFRLRLDTIPTALLIVLPLALLMSWPRMVTVWQTGIFYDTDDAMRMVQVRDWLAGQGWYDLVAHRLLPPDGLLMHWSRIVDVPIGLMMRLFGHFTDPVHAERLARLLFPLTLQAAMIAATAWVGRILIGPAGALPAALLIVLSGIAFGQFQPGRVDHHAPQILLLMLSLGTTLESLDPRKARFAAVTGLIIAVSLAISLENLPFFAVILVVPPIAWVVGGEAHRRQLVWFAGGLATCVTALFLLTVAPARWGAVTPDALCVAHVTGLGLGAFALTILAALSPRLQSARWRLLAAAVLGGAVALIVAKAYPGILRGPYGAMDPLVEALWLGNVREARSLIQTLAEEPDTVPLLVGPLLAGALATLLACAFARGRARGRWLIALALVGVGCAGAFWEIRVVGSVIPVALLAGAAVVANAVDFARRSRPLFLLLPFGALLVFSSVAWAMVPVPAGTTQKPEDLAAAAACRDPAAFGPLADLPAVTAFASIDSGSFILAHTKMSVIGAPYHRNQAGDLLVLKAFLAAPDAAKALIRASVANVVMICPGDPQLALAVRLAPQGLAASLLAGRVPDWLVPLPMPGTPYRVFAIHRDTDAICPRLEAPHS